ncbi:MAG: hypothetical protein ACPG66_07060 [Flavobacteriales bacterium]
MIAPILLPVFSLLTTLISSPAPILEWKLEPSGDRLYTLHLDLLASSEADVCKLSLVPTSTDAKLDLVAAPLLCDDHWSRNSTLNWMWNNVPKQIALDVTLLLPDEAIEPGIPLLQVVWEQIDQGQRQSWTLGTLAAPELQEDAASNEVEGLRKVTRIDDSTYDVALEVSGAQPESFVKWTEYTPEGCVCEVVDAAGASLRARGNQQMFLWFQVTKPESLTPKYRLTCDAPLSSSSFYGELEGAFGTAAKTSHIARVEWVGMSPDLNESMKLNPSSDTQSVRSQPATTPPLESDTRGTSEVRFAVQLLANHRDLNSSEVVTALGYTDPYHIFRQNGWHKYLTDDVQTYAEARQKRSVIWTTTTATDAFVTASLDGERITVQEALLMSNQSWNP